MRDPMSWALPIFRLFGIQVRVHLLFFVVTLGLFLRQISVPGDVVWWGDIFLFTVALLFGIILLHEFGHWVAWPTSTFRTTGKPTATRSRPGHS